MSMGNLYTRIGMRQLSVADIAGVVFRKRVPSEPAGPRATPDDFFRPAMAYGIPFPENYVLGAHSGTSLAGLGALSGVAEIEAGLNALRQDLRVAAMERARCEEGPVVGTGVVEGVAAVLTMGASVAVDAGLRAAARASCAAKWDGEISRLNIAIAKAEGELNKARAQAKVQAESQAASQYAATGTGAPITGSRRLPSWALPLGVVVVGGGLGLLLLGRK